MSNQQPERLYGLPGAEHMHLDISSCYESDIEPDREDGDIDSQQFTIDDEPMYIKIAATS